MTAKGQGSADGVSRSSARTADLTLIVLIVPGEAQPWLRLHRKYKDAESVGNVPVQRQPVSYCIEQHGSAAPARFSSSAVFP
ncbi:unnamed protein product [Phytophthora lilii]|uniref:Unnamed protein product n=1 Tax=Phytophthora lilii TaxID=2077276 RepID=A0A9W6TXU6_9STRA|nr:unnamed protein product [Phytophthora lilii]